MASRKCSSAASRRVGDVGHAGELGDLERAPERRVGRRDDRQPRAVVRQREQHAAARRCPGTPTSERSTTAGPGASASSSAPTSSALALSISPRTRATAHRARASTVDRRRPGTAGRERRRAARPVAHADGRAVGALVDVDRVHQRAHDAQPAPAIARDRRAAGASGRGRAPPASARRPARAPSATSTAASLPGRVGVLDRVRAQLTRRQHDQLGVARVHAAPASHVRIASRTTASWSARAANHSCSGATASARTRAASSATSSRRSRRPERIQQLRAERFGSSPAPRAARASRSRPTSSGSPRRSIAPSE